VASNGGHWHGRDPSAWGKAERQLHLARRLSTLLFVAEMGEPGTSTVQKAGPLSGSVGVARNSNFKFKLK
jgi:hypothetical protein